MKKLVPVPKAATVIRRPADSPSTPEDALNAYLSGLSPSSERPVRESLRYVVKLLDAPPGTPIERVAWHLVTYRVMTEIVRRLRLATTRDKDDDAEDEDDDASEPDDQAESVDADDLDPNGLPFLAPMSPFTANRHIAALRGVLRQCFLLGLMPSDEWSRIREVKVIKGTRVPKGRALGVNEIESLLNACDHRTLRGARDGAIMALLFACGLRRFEAAGAKLSNYDSSNGRLVIVGKGSKGRTVFLKGRAKQAVDHWLALRGPMQVDRILVRLNPHGALTRRPRKIGGSALLHAARRLAEMAEVRGFGCHDLRRTYATKQIEMGVDIFTVQRELGHARSDTTRAYDKRDESKMEEVADLLPFPWKGPKS